MHCFSGKAFFSLCSSLNQLAWPQRNLGSRVNRCFLTSRDVQFLMEPSIICVMNLLFDFFLCGLVSFQKFPSALNPLFQNEGECSLLQALRQWGRRDRDRFLNPRGPDYLGAWNRLGWVRSLWHENGCFYSHIACSQTPYFLFKARRARVIK